MVRVRRSQEVKRVVMKCSRSLLDIGEDHQCWNGDGFTTEDESALSRGAIVRLCPPPGTDPERVADLKKNAEGIGAVASKSMPLRRANAILQPKVNAITPMSMREMASAIVDEMHDVNDKLGKEVKEVLDRALSKLGI